jgi:hypothetical protein
MQGWFVNMYEIDAHDKQSSLFTWHKGGFQGGRGWQVCAHAPSHVSQGLQTTWTALLSGLQVNGTSGAIWPSPPFYIENVLEELDAPGEWFYNRTSRLLYLWWNATAGTPPPDGASAGETLVATRLARLVEVIGSKLDPVVGVQLVGLGFRDARYTCACRLLRVCLFPLGPCSSLGGGKRTPDLLAGCAWKPVGGGVSPLHLLFSFA